jgi:hypothetical protein
MSDRENDPEREWGPDDSHDVKAGEVTIRQGGARSVAAREVAIRQGGALRVQAEDVRITQGGVVFATTHKLRVTSGGLGGVVADEAELDQSAVQIVAARDEVEMDQTAAGVVIAKEAEVRDSAIGLLVTGRFEGHGNRVLMGPPAAFAFGAGVGLVLWLLGRWRR